MRAGNFGGGVTPSPENPVEIESFEITKFESLGSNFIGKFFGGGLGGAHRCTVSFDVTGAIVMNVTGEDPYINEVSTIVGTKYYNGNGRLYTIPDGATKIYSKSFDGMFKKNFLTFHDANKVSLGSAEMRMEEGQFNSIPSGARYVTVRIGKGDGIAGQTYKDRIMVSFSPIKEWVPPFYSEIPAKLTFRSLPDGICDEYLGDGKILRRVGHVQYDGSSDEPWFNRGDGMGYAISISDAVNRTGRKAVFCSAGLYIPGENTSKGSVTIGGDRMFSYFMGGEALNLVEWKTWLARTGMTVLYPLEKPVIETKAPYATVTQDSPVATEIEYEILTKSDYAADIIDIKKRLAALESAAIE